MANIRTIYPSKYLAAADLGDAPQLATINNVTFETMTDGESKPCAWFNEYDKGLILNKTNAGNIAAFCGDETDDWTGKKIVMVPTMVDFQGKSVEAIRVRAPKQKPATSARLPSAPETQSGPPAGHPAATNELNDEVPF